MGKLYFRYGAMGSSKTANALMVQYNYMEKGQKCILLKPKTDDRDGEKIVKSRMGLSAEATFVEEFIDEVKDKWFTGESEGWKELDCVIVDEAQFLTEEQVDILAEVVDRYDLPVICYGLRTDFTSHLFHQLNVMRCRSPSVTKSNTTLPSGRSVRINSVSFPSQ